MNYKCPCCAFPRLGPGRYVKKTWFGEKLIELVRNEKCKVCGSTYTAIFKVGKSNYDYNDVVFKDIQVPEKIVNEIEKIYFEKEIETETEFDYRDYLPRKSDKPDSDDNWHIDNETSFVKDGIEYFVVDLINKVGLVLLMGVVNGNVCVMGEKKYIYNYKPNFIISRPKV